MEHCYLYLYYLKFSLSPHWPGDVIHMEGKGFLCGFFCLSVFKKDIYLYIDRYVYLYLYLVIICILNNTLMNQNVEKWNNCYVKVPNNNPDLILSFSSRRTKIIYYKLFEK